MDPRVPEFHSIMPIDNVASVMQRGILCREFADKLRRKPTALPLAPDGRAQGHVPGGGRLHQYANLYFDARNPLLLRLRSEALSLCVLRVSVNALEIRGAVLTDGDAASDYVRFLEPVQWPELRLDDILAEDWEHEGDLVAGWRHASLKCAELLAPECFEPEFVVGAYVASADGEARLRQTGFAKWIAIDPWRFFLPEAPRDGA